MDNVQRESFTGMIQLLEYVLDDEDNCVENGKLFRFLEALADFTASRFYKLDPLELPWAHRAQEPSEIEMQQTLLSYGINTGKGEIEDNMIAARDYFIREYRKAVRHFRSE